MEDARKASETAPLDGQPADIEFVDGVDPQTGVSVAEYRKLFDERVSQEVFDILNGARIWSGDKRLANVLERQAIFSWPAKEQIMRRVPDGIIEMASGDRPADYFRRFSRAEIAYALVTLLTDCCFAKSYDPAVILVKAIRKFDGAFAKELIGALNGNNLWQRKIGADWINNSGKNEVGEAWGVGEVVKIAEAKIAEDEIMKRADETRKGVKVAAKV